METYCQALAGILGRQTKVIKPMNITSLSRRTAMLQLCAVLLIPAALVAQAEPGDAASLQSEAAAYLNSYRAKAGLPPLAPDAHLAAAAAAQCAIMIAHGRIGHSFGLGPSFSQRMQEAGVAPGYHAENVARGQRGVAEVMQAWMDSSGHRRNMLDPQMSVFGIAFKSGYWALDLAGPI
jgi:uncharacterized protein YkwD